MERKKGWRAAIYIHFKGGIKYITIKDDEIRQGISFSAI